MNEKNDIASLRPSERAKLGFVTDDNTGGYYVAECEECGQIFPSQNAEGGGPIADSGDYDDCYCPHCGHAAPEECDNANLVWNVQQLKIITLASQLEAERQRADDAERAGDKARSSRDLHHKVNAGLNERLIKAEAELAALRGEQEPFGFAFEDRAGNLQVTRYKPTLAHDHKVEIVELFTRQPKPVVVPEMQRLKEAVDFYLEVKKENPPVEQGMHKDADEWIKRAAIEAAGIVVKDGE